MRLWHYKLIPYLPKDMLVSQWRECIAIKRQWEKGKLKHRLVSYVMNYDKRYFIDYVSKVTGEMIKRKINYNINYYYEIFNFCLVDTTLDNFTLLKDTYGEHNNRYLKQCLYNLQEKYDRGIISETEWKLIENKFREELL